MSCLFNSLQFFLHENPQIIRNKICDYLENNGKIMDDLTTEEILKFENDKNYIENMRKSNVWGGAIEIQAACNIWNLKIIVKNIRDSNNSIIEFIPINKNYTKCITIQWNGGHYDPIRS